MTVLFLPCRLPTWIALTLFSLIALLSILDESHSNQRSFPETWGIVLSSISLGLASLATLAHLGNDLRDNFVASKIELFFILAITVSWILNIPVLMDANNDLALEESIVVDANLYFSSWLAFCCSLSMCASFGRGKLGEDTLTRYHARYWLCLFISSLVAMSAALRILNNEKGCASRNNVPKQCNQLRLGIALSIVSAVISAAIVMFASFAKNKSLPSALLLLASILVLVLWSVLVAYLTFQNGPGSKIGNLFFATWVSCILSLFLATSHIHAAFSPEQSSPSPSTSKKTTPSKTNTTKPKETKGRPEAAGRAYQEKQDSPV